MRKRNLFFLFLIILIVKSTFSFAQLPVQVRSGVIYINDGTIGSPKPNKYAALTDSLDKNLKLHPNDTTSLFIRGVLYLSLNRVVVNPDLGNKIAFENLVIAKNLAEKAVNLKMQNFYLRVLRAEIYRELAYRLAGDQSWKFNSKQITQRRSQFNSYKELANKYYDELAQQDKNNAWDYQKLKVKGDYPIKS
jgi:hypothetical protein